MGRLRSESQPLQPPAACLSRTASSPSPSSETNFTTGPWQARLQVMPKPTTEPTIFMNPTTTTTAAAVITTTPETSSKNNNKVLHPNLELQLSTTTNTNTTSSNPIDVALAASLSPKRGEKVNHSTQLQLSIGSSDMSEKNESNNNRNSSPKESSNSSEKPIGAAGSSMANLLKVQEQAREQLRIAMAEKAYAEEARKQAKRQIEMAEQEFTNAKRIRQQAQAELDKAYALKQHATKQINATMLQITCHACKQQFQARHATTTTTQDDNNSLVLSSYMSSAITTEGGEVENDNGKDNHGKITNS